MNTPRFESEWDGFKGHVAVTWDKLSDVELLRIDGNLDALVKLIAERYGEKKHDVEQRLQSLYSTYLEKKMEIQQSINDLKDDLQNRSHAMTDHLRQRAHEFQTNAKEKYQRIRDESIQPAVQKSEDYIKLHPFSAVLGALGVGVLFGTLIGLMSSRRD